MPIGSIAELLIEGPVLARGYLNAEQTRQAFVEGLAWVKSSPSERRRYYRTGDLFKYNADGTVSFIGRKDSQIKLRGRRIEIGEIEHYLASHPSVRQSIVMVPGTGIHAKRLVGIMTLEDNKPIRHVEGRKTGTASITLSTEQHESKLSDVKTFLTRTLPPYMIPEAWLVVRNIPLLISDKMDRVSMKKFVEGLTTVTVKTDNPES